MSSLRTNLVKRIDRLPKPTSVAAAMQPLFEAISNAIHSVQSRFGDQVAVQGKIHVTVSTERKKENVSASVEDNGLGLNEKNWDAFTTTDTDNKITIGGKGVGRLLWLDCFQSTQVDSVFESSNGALDRRTFGFVLALEDQIKDHRLEPAPDAKGPSFHVRFDGLRDNAYLAKFPGRDSFVFQHLTSHFLPTFIGGKCPQITVHVGDETRHYPSDIDKIVYRKKQIFRLRPSCTATLPLLSWSATRLRAPI